MGDEIRAQRLAQQRRVERSATVQFQVIDVAFYTTGDTRRTGTRRDVQFHSETRGRWRQTSGQWTNSERWGERAYGLAEIHAHGVSSTAEATRFVNSLPPNVRIRRLLFVGHGSSNQEGHSAFFLSGQPEGEHGFQGAAGVLWAPGAGVRASDAFWQAVKGRLVPDGSIDFLACYVGRGDMVRALESEINDGGGRSVQIGGTEHYYQVHAEIDRTGAIGGWSDHTVDGADQVRGRASGEDAIAPLEVTGASERREAEEEAEILGGEGLDGL